MAVRICGLRSAEHRTQVADQRTAISNGSAKPIYRFQPIIRITRRQPLGTNHDVNRLIIAPIAITDRASNTSKAELAQLHRIEYYDIYFRQSAKTYVCNIMT